MKQEDLIKKLKETPLPKIELPSHKKELKQALLSKYPKQRKGWEVFDVLKKAVPIGAVTIILLFLILNNLIFPKYTLVQAKEIALRNPQVRELVERGAIIKDIKIIKNKGYVLIQQSPEAKMETEEMGAEIRTEEEFLGALAEVDLKEKQVSRIEQISPQVFPLDEEEKEKAEEIAEKNLKIQGNIPSEAKIKEITPLPYLQLKLIEEKNSIRVVPEAEEEKKVRIIYELNEEQWEGKVDLVEEKVEMVKPTGEPEQ